MPYTKLTNQSELPPTNEVKEFPCGDKIICVANVDGKISALDNVCLHHGASEQSLECVAREIERC